jgi:8-oxo-dGTP pyrophosphatase MutT (NUDIX family)
MVDPFSEGRIQVCATGADRTIGHTPVGSIPLFALLFGAMTDELVDWVDDQDRVISVVTRGRMRAEALLHRSVGIHVWSSEGRILIHRRSDGKDLHPGWWDMGAGGVVAAGETYDEAAARELAEELGLYGTKLEPLGGGRFDSAAFCSLVRFYRTISDGPFTFDDGEITECRFVTLDELQALIRVHNFMPDSLALGGPFLGL